MQYVIAGAGPAGVIAAETLRKNDPEGDITLIGAEDSAPYSRMAIPYLLKGEIAEEGTYLRRGENHYENLGIKIIRGQRVTAVSPGDHSVTLSDGSTVTYDRLLITTGSNPVRPPIPGMDLPLVQSCWTLADAHTILGKIGEGAQVVLMGAGFIGTIILDAIAKKKATLTVVEAESRMVPRMINEAGGAIIKKWCEDKGVTVLTSTRVEEISEGGSRALQLKLSDGQQLEADLVICATGVLPNTGFLEGSGIQTDQGILVNEFMQSSEADIYAAGDVAQGPDFSFGGQAIHAIQPTASDHAQIAALNMAGKVTPYKGSLSMNTVDIMGLVYYSFGKWMGTEGGSHGEATNEANHTYLRLEFEGDRLVGAIRVGVFEQIGVLRGMIENRIALGEWKATLEQEPGRFMEAYLTLTKGGVEFPTLRIKKPA